jgi:zinc transporter ZupT
VEAIFKQSGGLELVGGHCNSITTATAIPIVFRPQAYAHVRSESRPASSISKKTVHAQTLACTSSRFGMPSEITGPLPSGLWERPFAAAALFGFGTYFLNLVGVLSAMCLSKVSPEKEAYFSAVSAGLILASATGGLISGAVTTAHSEGIRGALPLSSGLLFALLTMMAFERLLVYLQRKNPAMISWMLATPIARDADDEGAEMLQHQSGDANEHTGGRTHGRHSHEAASSTFSSNSLHEVIEQSVGAGNNGVAEGAPAHAKLRSAMMLVLAMMVHHVPESMALGVAVYGVSDGSIQQGQCIVLAAVLALQNIPEGAACTSSLRMLGMKNSWRLVFIAQLAGCNTPDSAFPLDTPPPSPQPPSSISD